jgi:hypothetical protein
MIAPGLLILLRITFAICSPLSFHMNFRFYFSNSIQNEWHWNSDGNCIQTVDFVSIAMFAILILLVHEEASFSFFRVLWVGFVVGVFHFLS